jgi:hypothetical protein
MKLAARTFLVSLVALCSLAVTTYAAAFSPRTTTVTTEQVYRIDTAIDTAELKVKVAALALDERRVQARITPCLAKAFVPIFEAAQAKSIPNADKALDSLSAEAGAEYEIASIKPIISPLLSGVGRILKLQLPATLRSQLKGFVPAFSEVQSLNVCADARAWFAAGLASAREPRGTARTSVALSDIRKLTASTVGVEVGHLTPSQLRNRKLDTRLTDEHITELGKQSNNALKSWIDKLIQGVEQTVEKTQKTTTTN